MPVFANEPCTVLMKAGEVSYFLSDLSKVAKIHDSPTKRMLYLACIYSSAFNQVLGRLSKPFNPLLGETYELVTPKFRFLAECVSHHPPIVCMNLQGENFMMQKMGATNQKFNGKSVYVTDPNDGITTVWV